MRARDLCTALTDDVVSSEEGSDRIVQLLPSRDALTVVSEVFHDFNDLLSCKRSNSESYLNFEGRFAPPLAKLNRNGKATQLPESLTAIMLLTNAAVENSQRVSVLAAAAPSDPKLTNQCSTDDFLKAVSYCSISSVLSQCDKS